MMNMLRLFLSVLLLAMALEAGTSCKKRAKKFNKCLENGYSPKIFTDCQAEGEAMTGKRKIKKCTRVEKRFSKFCDTESLECQSSGKIVSQSVYQLWSRMNNSVREIFWF